MTIRRRLFWSNILMILIPVLLCAVVSYVILFLFTRNSAVPIEQAFPQALGAVAEFARSGNMASLEDSIDEFNAAFGENGVFMTVLDGDFFLYPQDSEALIEGSGPLLQILIREGGTGSVTINGLRFIIERVGDYRIIVVDSQAGMDSGSYRPPMRHVNSILVAVIIAILFANRIVAHLLTKRLLLPINELAKGANELGNGNLEYRIRYLHNDEFFSVCRDFNNMAEQLQKLIRYQQKNEASRKELLAGISHDLRTPLTSIKAYVEGLLDGVAEDLPSQLKYLGIIRNKAEDIDRLVDKLFLFSKLDIGEYPVKLERVDIGDELRAMARVVEEEYREKGLIMELESSVRNVEILMDPVYLHNIFLNILENSLRYKTKEQCTVRVRCRVEEAQVTVSISDDGPGVPQGDLEKIFEVFYRGTPPGKIPARAAAWALPSPRS